VGGMLTLPLQIRPDERSRVKKAFHPDAMRLDRLFNPILVTAAKKEDEGKNVCVCLRVCKTPSVAERRGVGRTATAVLSRKGRL